MSTGDEQDPPGKTDDRSAPGGRAAHDSTAPRITLPGLDAGRAAAASRTPASRTPGEDASQPVLDAWNEDHVRRSSYPPAGPGRWARQRVATRAEPQAPSDEAAEDGDAFDLVHRSSSTLAAVDLAVEMEERFSFHDFSGALRVAEFLLGRNPKDPLAQHYAACSRRKLEQILYNRLTRGGTVPLVAVRDGEARWLGLDSRAAWLLSRVDGSSDCETLLEGLSLERLEGLRLLNQLLDVGAIRMR